jgi:hypothetical protein
VIFFIIVLDELGDELTLWYYTVDIIFLFPPITAVDITSLPLLYMLMYQRFQSWKSFAAASAVMSVVSCFILEQVFVWAGIYRMITWRSYYGLPFYFAIAILSKFIVGIVFNYKPRQEKA